MSNSNEKPEYGIRNDLDVCLYRGKIIGTQRMHWHGFGKNALMNYGFSVG